MKESGNKYSAHDISDAYDKGYRDCQEDLVEPLKEEVKRLKELLSRYES